MVCLIKLLLDNGDNFIPLYWLLRLVVALDFFLHFLD